MVRSDPDGNRASRGAAVRNIGILLFFAHLSRTRTLSVQVDQLRQELQARFLAESVQEVLYANLQSPSPAPSGSIALKNGTGSYRLDPEEASGGVRVRRFIVSGQCGRIRVTLTGRALLDAPRIAGGPPVPGRVVLEDLRVARGQRDAVRWAGAVPRHSREQPQPR